MCRVMAVVFNATYRFSMKAMMYDLNKIKKKHISMTCMLYNIVINSIS